MGRHLKNPESETPELPIVVNGREAAHLLRQDKADEAMTREDKAVLKLLREHEVDQAKAVKWLEIITTLASKDGKEYNDALRRLPKFRLSKPALLAYIEEVSAGAYGADVEKIVTGAHLAVERAVTLNDRIEHVHERQAIEEPLS